MSRQLLVVSVAETLYALPSELVREITTLPSQVTRLPGAEPSIRGLINVRGQLFPVMDLCHRLRGVPGNEAVDVLVVVSDGKTLGLLVDDVRDVIPMDEPAASVTAPDEADTSVVRGVGHSGEMVVIELDVPKLVRSSLA